MFRRSFMTISAAALVALTTVGAITGCSTVMAQPASAYSLENPAVKPGIETLLSNPEFFALVKGKRVGLITNPTGVDSRLRSTVDILHEHPEINLVSLFGPEHGVRGDAYAGVKIDDAVDARTGIPERSLYGTTRRPPKEYLEGIDVMLYDIQDVGSRSYTYIYTMAYAMEECGKAGIPFVVLDRPNPCGDRISGNILNVEEGTSFVGLYPITYMYGMTPGETAKMFNELFNSDKCELHVVTMDGYKREMLQWDTGLPFVPTSPQVPTARHSMYYNLTGIIGELRTISIGVGYTLPFEVIAAPWIDAQEFTDAINAKNLPGLLARPITYRPAWHHFSGEPVHGAHLYITDFTKIEPVEAQIHIMEIITDLYPEQAIFSDENIGRSLIDRVIGTKSIRQRIAAGDRAADIINDYIGDIEEFKKLREPFLIYE